jgi:hypothetical protein
VVRDELMLGHEVTLSHLSVDVEPEVGLVAEHAAALSIQYPAAVVVSAGEYELPN